VNIKQNALIFFSDTVAGAQIWRIILGLCKTFSRR